MAGAMVSYKMEMIDSIWLMFGIMPYLTAWALLWYHGDTSSSFYRKSLFYCAQMQFIVHLFMFMALILMIMEVLYMLDTAQDVEELSQSSSYRAMPGFVKWFAESEDENGEGKGEDEDDAAT